MNNQDVVLITGHPKAEEKLVVQYVNMEGKSFPSVRGLLLRRRCDSCGTRISIQGEDDNSVTMQCPKCQRQYVFFQRPA